MNKTGLFAVVALLLGGASCGLGFYAGQTNASSITTADPEVVSAAPAADTSEIEAIVKNYLLKNPEIMLEVQTALETLESNYYRLSDITDGLVTASVESRDKTRQLKQGMMQELLTGRTRLV